MPKLLGLVALCVVMSVPLAHAQKMERVAIFVGPQTRDGFVDIDEGILDSINDVQHELRGARELRLVARPQDARLVLFVTGRHVVGESGSIGVPIGASTIFLPLNRRAIDSTLHVGGYEKSFTSVDDKDDHWKACARQVVKDVTAWVEANRAQLAK